ncbi:MAG: hemerythrin family protein [Burkholderiaceae bacterium]|nr:hemerythrin family protein [Burkholderiaceae bacterium]
MPIAIWTPELSLGVASLDADHQKLIDTLNLVFDALLFDRSSSALNSALTTLDDYVTEHFAREEAWMQARHHPDLARHQQEHKALRDHLALLCASRDLSDQERSVELLMILRDWLLGHIAHSDRDASGA